VIRAALLAACSALLGGGIALVARRRPAVLERTRTFAFAAAAGVVAFHLLPEALPRQGLTALLWMGAGFALPWLLEAVARAVGPGLLESRGLTGLRVAAEVGFAALIFHSVAEGLALVAALSGPGQADLEIALVAHHAPLTAAVVLPFLELRGPRSVAVRSATIAGAGMAGVLLSGVVPGFGEGALLQKATALTAGALLHVVADEIRAQRFDSPWERAADLGACAAGLLVAGYGAALHLQDPQDARSVAEFLGALAGTSLVAAPALLLGAAAAPLVGRRIRVDAFVLALVLLGPVAAAAMLALRLLAPFAPSSAPARRLSPGEVFDAVAERGPPVLALLVLAAGLDVAVASVPMRSAEGVLMLAAVALAARLDLAGAVAVAAVLVRKGLDPGLTIAMLAIGPATRAFAAAEPPRRAGALVFACVALAVGWLLSRSGVIAGAALAPARSPVAEQLAASPFAAISAAILLALALVTLWNAGVRGWFAPLRHDRRSL
jgi:hypothetical protein